MSLAPRIDRIDRNYIINGGLEFWQRVAGNTLTINDAAGGNALAADRFMTGRAGTTIKNYALVRQTDAPTLAQAGVTLDYSLSIGVNTAIPSFASTDILVPIQYRMEGNDYKYLHGKTVTLSFWLKTFFTGSPPQVPVAFSNNSNRCYVTTVTSNATNTWEYKTVTIQLESGSGWNFDTSTGLKISIGAVTGSANQASTANTWIAGDFFTVSGSWNFMSSTSNGIRIAGISLVQGSEAPAVFTRAGRTYNHELQLCQRYYEKSYNVDNPPGTSTYEGIAGAFAAGASVHQIPFKVMKRATPTMTTYSVGGVINSSSSSAPGSTDSLGVFSNLYYGMFGCAFGFSSGSWGRTWHWVADAEL